MISGKHYPALLGFILSAGVTFAFCQDSVETDSIVGKIQTADSVKHNVPTDENAIDTGDTTLTGLQHKNNVSTAKSNDSTASVTVDKKKTTTDSSLVLNPPDNKITKTESNNKDLFKTIGEYHKLTGIYQVIEGAMIILAGAILINKEDYSTFAMSFIAVGGINIGLGLWEIKISSGLINNSCTLKK
jgi:hypothetical protein